MQEVQLARRVSPGVKMDNDRFAMTEMRKEKMKNEKAG